MIGWLVSPAGATDFWDISIVDMRPASYTSLAILPSGHPAISYCYEGTYPDLKYAWYDGSNWQTTTVDSAVNVGSHSSIAILPSGHPAISYHDSFPNYDLKYAWYDGSIWQKTIVDSVGDVGRSTSLAILPSGYPSISYYDNTNDDLKYAWYDGSAWQTSTVDSTGDVGYYSSLAVLPSGQPAISYYDWTNANLKYAWYDGSAWQTTIVDSAGGGCLAILPSGQPAISYGSYPDLKYAWYDGSSWQTTTVDSSGVVGYTSLAIQPSGQPAISYRDNTNDDLKYTWYDGSTWQTATVDSAGDAGRYASLAILPSGLPIISYCDETMADLKFASSADISPAPLTMAVSYTATAWTDLGGTTTEVNGPAYNNGSGSGYEWAESSVQLETTIGGHLRGVIALAGHDGSYCSYWDPFGGGCLEYHEVSCRDANGTLTGTIVLGTSESYPAGSDIELALEVLVAGAPGDAEDYHLKLWRGVSLIGQVNAGAPEAIIVPVFAGETLTFEVFALEEARFIDIWHPSYDREFEFRLILRGPANLDGKGTVDFRDFAIFALHWLDTGCVDPTWCSKTDFNKTGDVILPDLKIFAGHWLEGTP